MGEFVELEINDDVAAEEAVVEDEVHEVVVFIEGEAALPCLEEETFSKLEEEVLEVIDDGGLQI